ncbi:myelin-associated glycoprotein-like isoform X1 [Lepisosteus oculatus]|uniref:myelin-associated glycoprotein-like isoform X1 n=1 Tax=Lepisosteus oculatus TaxID=7918 RepID=UPI0037127320
MEKKTKMMFVFLCVQVIHCPAFANTWSIETVSEIKSLVGSCVVLPCTFDYEGHDVASFKMSGSWHTEAKDPEYIYHTDIKKIILSFHGRTKLVGKVGERNCSLEIDKVSVKDKGPYCFRIEITGVNSYSFMHDCVSIDPQGSPESPLLFAPKTAHVGTTYNVSCSARHTCSTHQPSLKWTGISTEHTVYKDLGQGIWEVLSTGTFTPKSTDNVDLTCTAEFWRGKSETSSVSITVQTGPEATKSPTGNEVDNAGLGDIWKVKLIPEITAVIGSCVVIPCGFQFPGDLKVHSMVRRIWKNNKGNIYHNDQTQVLDSFKGRTKLVGEAHKDENCTLEINEVKTHDKGPYWLRVEIPEKDNYSFKEKYVTMALKGEPEKPVLTYTQFAHVGSAYSVTCSVRHSCPTNHPTLSWDRTDGETIVHYKDIGQGNWEVSSVLTFTPLASDHNTRLTCSAQFFKLNNPQESSITLNVKSEGGAVGVLSIAIPVAAVVVIAIILVGLYKWKISRLNTSSGNLGGQQSWKNQRTQQTSQGCDSWGLNRRTQQTDSCGARGLDQGSQQKDSNVSWGPDHGICGSDTSCGAGGEDNGKQKPIKSKLELELRSQMGNVYESL